MNVMMIAAAMNTIITTTITMTMKAAARAAMHPI